MKIIVSIVSYVPSRYVARFEDDLPSLKAEGQTPEEAVGKLVIQGGFRKGLALQMPDWERAG
jgi:hypothetical protein